MIPTSEENKRNRTHGFQILRNRFAGNAISTRGPDRKLAMFVDEFDRDAVDLRFGDVLNVDVLLQEALNPLLKFLHLLATHDIAEREHGDGVANLSKCRERGSPDALRGRQRIIEFRMLGLQFD